MRTLHAGASAHPLTVLHTEAPGTYLRGVRNVLERILNLLAYLLTSPRPVTADDIRHTVAGYDQENDVAFQRMFSRDKELLRKLGIPLETRSTGVMELEHGYVIDPDSYRLPETDLTDEERTALWFAAQVVRIGGQPSGADAILKLGGSRIELGLEPFGADLGAGVEVLADLYTAAGERRPVDFVYSGKARTAHPHGLGHRRGHWYLVAVVGDDVRVFRVDRISDLELGDPGDSNGATTSTCEPSWIRSRGRSATPLPRSPPSVSRLRSPGGRNAGSGANPGPGRSPRTDR